MEWILTGPQIQSTFGSLGFLNGDGYHVNEACNESLNKILYNIVTEDKFLRTYRRNISFGQYIKKDLIPLLIHAKDYKTIDLLIQILVQLTLPVENLIDLESLSKSEFGRHEIYELNNLLKAAKATFTDLRTTKVIIDFLKKNVDCEQNGKISPENFVNISNCLLLVRNILHISEEARNVTPGPSAPSSIQNQILWNIFSQSIDKLLIKLMTVPESYNWCVTMVQMIALIYKDQHVVSLLKLLNLWLDSSLCESSGSEDNESNTSSSDRGGEDSTPIITSNPTSDSSDNGSSGKSNDKIKILKTDWQSSAGSKDSSRGFLRSANVCVNISKNNKKANKSTISEGKKANYNASESQDLVDKTYKNNTKSENSDFGYVTQIEKESISTLCNKDSLPAQKPVHQRPQSHKQRVNSKSRAEPSLQDKKRRKIVKRVKSNIINVQGLSHETPTDDDISNIIKEFTVDFLLKGYNSLAYTLLDQVSSNPHLGIDTSHLFWLVSYFLKFATQIELDLEHVCSILSLDMVSYLSAEGVSLCEQFELAIRLDGNNLKPNTRKMHLIVTAIRELVQAIGAYQKCTHTSVKDKEILSKLHVKMCELQELRSLLILLLRHYNPKYHSKQYLQDLVITNHILLLFLDNAMRQPDYKGTSNLLDHIKQFATEHIMYRYGLLLQDYEVNGEFVNDCIFTMMHHVGSEPASLQTLHQPIILKAFTAMVKSEFEVCDDWSDLIEYLIKSFIKKKQTLQNVAPYLVNAETVEDDNLCKPLPVQETKEDVVQPPDKSEIWKEEEISSLNWHFMQCKSSLDTVGDIVKLLNNDGINKTRASIINELHIQNMITQTEYEDYLRGDRNKSCNASQLSKEERDGEISKLCEQLLQDGKLDYLHWIQEVLLDACFVKIYMEKQTPTIKATQDANMFNIEFLKKQPLDVPLMYPVPYLSLLQSESIPLVPWTCQLASICKDPKLLQLLHRLGFHMPVNTGRVFIRIPYSWSAAFLYEVASKISPIDMSKLSFRLSDTCAKPPAPSSLAATSTLSGVIAVNSYRAHKPNHFNTMVNFTPTPGPSINSNGAGENFVKGTNESWLQIVQRSQQINLSTARVDTESGQQIKMKIMTHPSSNEIKVPLVLASDPESSDSGSTNMTPILVPTTVVRNDISKYNNVKSDDDADSYTASMSSDLTHMYVSDEESSSSPPVSPSRTPAAPDRPPRSPASSPDRNLANKRTRISHNQGMSPQH